MTRVIVDASVLVASAMADGRTRRALLSLSRVELFAPAIVEAELRRQIPRIARRAGLAEDVVRALIDDLLSVISTVPPEGYSGALARALSLAERAGAPADAEYVALALTLEAPIWTLDDDFQRIPGVKTINRPDVEALDR